MYDLILEGWFIEDVVRSNVGLVVIYVFFLGDVFEGKKYRRVIEFSLLLICYIILCCLNVLELVCIYRVIW